MAQNSAIEWTHHTFNCWWGCIKVSPACKRCYADRLATRFGYRVWGAEAERRRLSEAAWRAPVQWDAQAKANNARSRVFCMSMGDVFEDRRDLDSERARLWELILRTGNLDWLLLTKRPENIERLAPWSGKWPFNIWLGTTAETQEYADARIPLLLQHDARVHFVSAEPLLSEVSLAQYLRGYRRLRWVITGGESGPGARPSQPDWLRRLRDECVDAAVPFFVKQWGAHTLTEQGLVRLRSKKQAGRVLDGREWDEVPALPRMAGEAPVDGLLT